MRLAEPWWVNMLILVPVISYFSWRARALAISIGTLIGAACFATAFGFVEAGIVVYLRAIIGQLPGSAANPADLAKLSSAIYQQPNLLGTLPESLLIVEIYREAATMVMLLSVACLSADAARQRWALFLWNFAIWDIFYYVGLWATVGWPSSWLTPDVLFLIPVPWFSQVWFPILVSALTIGTVISANYVEKRT